MYFEERLVLVAVRLRSYRILETGLGRYLAVTLLLSEWFVDRPREAWYSVGDSRRSSLPDSEIL